MTDGSTGGPAAALPGPRRGRAVNEELRGMAVAAVLGGLKPAAAARRFGLGATTLRRWVKQFREHGHVRPGRQGGNKPSRTEPERGRILRILAARPELSMAGLRDALAAEGVMLHESTVQRFLKRHGLDRKTRLAARQRRRGRGRK